MRLFLGVLLDRRLRPATLLSVRAREGGIMKVKAGVQAVVLHSSIEHVLEVAEALHQEMYGTDLTVTALQDGDHMAGSLHYGLAPDPRCRAVDVRTRDLKRVQPYATKLRELLGLAFDVVVEKDHIHIEYDLKGKL